MTNFDEFIRIANQVIDPTGNRVLNQEQSNAVAHSTDHVLQIVAGPGSGKTTVLILRGLRLVFVDGIMPEQILVVTFTKKAASELRSRWLRYGEAIKSAIGGLDHIDLNRCQIGTLDSIAQQALTDHHSPGETAPIVMDKAASLLVLRRFVFPSNYRPDKDVINQLLMRYTFDGKEPKNQGEALRVTQGLLERLVQDQVEVASYRGAGPSENAIADILQSYQDSCRERNAYDFAGMENLFLDRLTQGNLDQWTTNIKALLIDEYQDTNSLQETIYFSIITATGATTTIVGDDDQSLYRFRGGSVELFTDFAKRCQHTIGFPVERIDIVANYRSTPEIVDFYNSHIVGDPGFAQARINPPKPRVTATRASNGIGVLGMLRPNANSLAESITDFLTKLVKCRQYQVGAHTIELPTSGDLGDILFLSHSVNEKRYFMGTLTEYFPLTLRRKLEAAGLEVYNARGQSLRDVPDVQQLLGLILLSVDPAFITTADMRLTGEVNHYLKQWRESAKNLIVSRPEPNDKNGLEGFIKEWQDAAFGQHMDGESWREWPVLEIFYRLLTWLPAFLNEPEHQAWLHAILGNIDGVTPVSAFEMKLSSNTKNSTATDDHIVRSRQAFIRDALVPIAEDNVDINEDIMPSIPRNRLQMMTIHQAKGLEFPMIIVDVGSRFSKNHPSQKFLRFPDKPSNVVVQEDDMEPYLPAPLRGNRTQLDRTFDDLARLYYVAYSRPQSVLLLVANESCLKGKSPIPNIALGWRRDGKWPWNTSATRRPPIMAETPFLRI